MSVTIDQNCCKKPELVGGAVKSPSFTGICWESAFSKDLATRMSRRRALGRESDGFKGVRRC